MKLKPLFVLGSSILLLTACGTGENGEETEASGSNAETSNEENADNTQSANLIDKESLNDGGWINFEGNVKEQEGMMNTESIPYDPSKEYELNSGAYVTYFNGEEFIETKLIQDNLPGPIETVDEADSIQLSFHKDFIDMIELKEK
ncbi:hypothetical protein WN59_10175 [Salinicoccus sediminis]|uniref:Lipoprotein n=1 Tax=Salinicoccus sediminis TaxID=1432562 RepID=A0A0M2SGW5_9STAP|nr:hypothetical protein [Salinicoccus sediminis]KKK33959.1 hypothetical protein WN59_10175 [Salinicoccus sediminis]